MLRLDSAVNRMARVGVSVVKVVMVKKYDEKRGTSSNEERTDRKSQNE